MQLVDTHCHIHFPDYPLAPDEVINRANQAGVTRLICVGCTLQDSKIGIEFAAQYKNVWSSIGIHPHEAAGYVDNKEALNKFVALAKAANVVAIGECGLDYYYNYSPKQAQMALLKLQIELALQHDLPLIFHVREAFADFWSIFDNYKGIKGVVHSFSGTSDELDQIIKHQLFIGLNGIMTFTKNNAQLEAVRTIPLDKIVVETDAPYLTPAPYRGTICEPKHVRVTAEFLSRLRGESLEQFAAATTQNAVQLFGLAEK